MGEWRKCKLGDVAKFSYGTMPKKDKLDTGIYPTFSGYKYQYLYPEINCKKGDVIVVARGVGGTGDVKIVREDCYLTNLSIKIDFDNSIVDNKFFYYNYFLETLRYLDSGSAQSQITIADLSNEYFSLPSLEEQKAIAEVLSSLDDKIDLLHRQNKTLEEMAQTLFRQWFVEEAKEGWEIKFSDAPIQIIDGDRGNNYPKNSDFFSSEYCLFLSAKNVTKNGFNFVDCSFITKERDELLRKGKLSRNDVVLTTRGTVGNIAYYHELIPFKNIRINSGMVILRADETKISSLYLYILMKSSLFSESVIEHTSGSAQPQIPIRDLNNVSFILPPEDIYNKFMDQVEPIYFKVFSNQKQIKTLENMRDTLLPKLMSGEVRVGI
ncbi:MAG: restriction endonuclease subunit S [Sulfurovum sp.]|nr:restriction endonuclease subunit S [Sulfurovum sp.]